MPTKKKKQSRLSKINFKSPKTRGLIILLAFAVIGGGVMVFRSFAATTVLESRNHNPTNKLLAPAATGGCSAKEATETSKGTAAVFSLACPTTSTGTASVATIGSSGAASQYYRACAMIKGAASSLLTIQGGQLSAGTNPYSTANGYTYFCTGTIQLSSFQPLTGTVTVGKGNAVNVSYIVIERVSAPDVTPTAGPTVCEKNCTGGK